MKPSSLLRSLVSELNVLGKEQEATHPHYEGYCKQANKQTNNQCWQRCGEIRIRWAAGGSGNGAGSVDNSLAVLEKTEIKLPNDSGIPLLSICLDELEAGVEEIHVHPFHDNIAYHNPKEEATQILSDG